MTSPTLILPERSRSIASDLRAAIGVDKVKDDYSTLTAYAVDASIYRMTPQAVVLVESEEDIAATVRYAVQRGIPLTPRAAGTNLTGSAIGSGIILDVSRLNRVLELNREERWARVQPGIVLAELNKHLGRHGLMFGPDPSSGDMCKLGGMLANNSSGPHTLRYGAVKDNVEALRVCLQSGEWLDAKAYGLDDPDCADLLKTHRQLRDLRSLLQDNATLIEQKRPTVSKNSCGYNLFGLARWACARPLRSSQSFSSAARARSVSSVKPPSGWSRNPPRPSRRSSIFTAWKMWAMRCRSCWSLSPSALEVMDANTLNLIGRAKHGIPVDAAATLLVELDADGGRDRSPRTG